MIVFGVDLDMEVCDPVFMLLSDVYEVNDT